MTEAILYARISDEYQQGDGYSIDAQIERGKEYAARLQMPVAHVYVEKETAKTTGRPVFNEMLAWVKKQKKPVALLVEKTDRLYRNYRDHLTVDDLITEHGLEVHFFKEGEILAQDASSHTKLIHGIKVVLAKNYIDNLREEVKKGTRQKLLAGGWPHRAPYGYRNDRKQIVINPERSPFVLEVFGLYASGLYSLERLSEKLIETGWVYLPSQPKISRASLSMMLRNPFYIGEMQVGGEIFPGKHEALITRATWLQVQEALRRDGKPFNYRKNEYRFQGLMSCASCGGSVVGEAKKGGKYVYYRCCENSRGCEQGYVREETLSEAFEDSIRSIAVSKETAALIRQAYREMDDCADASVADDLDLVNRQLVAAQKRKRQAYFDRADGLIDEDFYREVATQVEQEIFTLKVRFESLSAAQDKMAARVDELLELPKILARKWIAANDRQKRKILKDLCSNWILDGEKLHYKLNPVFALLTKQGQKQEWWAKPDAARMLICKYSDTIKRLHAGLAA